jgi:aconitate hydratase
VLSGNRNFPGRVHGQIDAALLASPPLVVAFALAGRAGIDITRDPIAPGVTLRDLWPSRAEIESVLAAAIDAGDVAAAYPAAEASGPWAALEAPETARFPWDAASTYLRPPPFVTMAQPPPGAGFTAHPLLVLGDDLTTDHISPAGAIPPNSDAGQWLIERGEDPRDLNVYASRRGNWEVMVRGLFTNRSVVNHIAPGAPAGHTVFAPTGEVLPAYRAAARYAEAGLPVVIIAGERYGTGSSRDWAAKGTALLGVKAVIAESYERIHRSNLIGMGVIPLQYPAGQDAASLGLTGEETFSITGITVLNQGRTPSTVRVAAGDVEFDAVVRIDTPGEAAYFRNGGIMQYVLRNLLRG